MATDAILHMLLPDPQRSCYPCSITLMYTYSSPAKKNMYLLKMICSSSNTIEGCVSASVKCPTIQYPTIYLTPCLKQLQNAQEVSDLPRGACFYRGRMLEHLTV